MPEKKAQAQIDVPGELQMLRRENQKLRRRVAISDGAVEVITGIVRDAVSRWDWEFDIPEPVTPKPAYDEECIALAHFTDLQCGKVTKTYNSEIARARSLEYAQKVAKSVFRYNRDKGVKKLHVYWGGDMVEGELIFPHQAHEIDESVFDQACVTVPQILTEMLVYWLQHFQQIEVFAVAGNHGRPASRAAGSHPKTNWDRVAYECAKLMLEGTLARSNVDRRRVKVNIADDFYIVDHCLGQKNLLVHGDQIRGGFGGFPWYGLCVPEDHEILTKRGWRGRSELILGEDVLTFDPQTHENRWEPLEDIHVQHYGGDLLTLERPGHSMRFTPDHRWPFVKGHGPRGMVRARDFNSNDWIPKKGRLKPGGESCLAPRHAAILGWIVTDGSARWRGNHWEAGIYQSHKKHLEEVEELVGRPGNMDARSGVAWAGLKIEDSKAISAVYRSKEDLPEIVGNLGLESAEAMFDAMMKAEGCDGYWSQKPGPVAEAFQMLSVITGRTAWGVPDKVGMMRYRVLKKDTIKPLSGQGMRREGFRGTVWCPQTKTGTWWVRHGGMVLPTGNSRKMSGWADSLEDDWNHLYFGHFHQMVAGDINGRRYYCGGTPESDNAYARAELASAGRPQQRLQLVTAEQVVCDLPIYLNYGYTKPSGRRRSR